MKTKPGKIAAILLVTVLPVLAGENPAPGILDILVSSDTNIYAEAVSAFQSAYPGPVNVQYLDVVLEDGDGKAYFERVENSDAHVFVAVGPAAARLAVARLKKKPVLLSMVNAPRTLRASGRTICGVSMDVPVSDFFRTLRELAPAARRVASFYSTDDGSYLTGEGDYADVKFGLEFQRRRVTTEGFAGALDSLRGKVDAFYMPADPLYDRARFEALSAFARENKIVLMTSFSSLLVAGATFALTPDYGRMGFAVGNMASRIQARQTNCASEGFAAPDEPLFYLNRDYAKASGIEVPPALVERARLTGILNTGVNLLQEGKLRSAQAVFQAVLDRDPGNKAAQSYRDVVAERLSGGMVRGILEGADRQYSSGRYAQAVAEYKRALGLNPSLARARAGLDRALFAWSEEDRREGLRLEESGQQFDALRFFQSALRTLETNASARADQERVRQAVAGTVPQLLAEGIRAYNNREYEVSITQLQNVLLVDPQNRKAAEYLRLAIKKKEAIDRLMKKP